MQELTSDEELYIHVFAVQDASLIAFELYGLRAEARKLPAERDYNFHLKAEGSRPPTPPNKDG